MAFLPVVILLASATLTMAQIPWAGDCPGINPVQAFDSEKYQGVWYEAQRYFFLPEITGSCISVNQTLMLDGTFSTQIRFKESISNYQIVYPGTTILLDAPAKVGEDPISNTGNMQLTLNIINPFTGTTIQKAYNFRVVSTDYLTYAIHWACYSFGAVHFKSVWVVTRDPNYPSDVRTNVRKELDRLSINRDLFFRTDQQNCVAENVG